MNNLKVFKDEYFNQCIVSKVKQKYIYHEKISIDKHVLNYSFSKVKTPWNYQFTKPYRETQIFKDLIL